MTKEPRGAGEVGDAGRSDDARAADDADKPAEDEIAAQHRSTVSWLDVARARRDGLSAAQAPSPQPPPSPQSAATTFSRTVTPPAEARSETTDATAAPQPGPAPSPPSSPVPTPAPTPAPGPAPSSPPKHTPKHAIGGPATSRHIAPRRVALPEDRVTDSVTASREVMGALSGEEQHAPNERRDPPQAGTPAPRSSQRAQARASAPTVGSSLNVEFPPKLGARRIVGALLILGLAATSAAAFFAYEDPRPLTLGGAGTLLVVTLALYAVRAGSSPTRLAIRSGQLEVTRGKSVERFDLTSRFTRIEVVGKPGRPGWKVLLGRFGKSPLVITSSVVDPKLFTAELARYQPRP